MGTNITCPRCRKNHFLNVSSIRIRGTFLIVIGLFLVAFMGGIAIFVAALLFGSASQNVSSARRLNDEIPMLILIYGIFALVIAFGLNSLISGLWMIVTGRRNRVLLWIMWGLLGLLGIGSILVRSIIG